LKLLAAEMGSGDRKERMFRPNDHGLGRVLGYFSYDDGDVSSTKFGNRAGRQRRRPKKTTVCSMNLKTILDAKNL